MTAELIEAGAPMAYLDGLTGYEQTGRLESPTLERMGRLVDAMGSPQRSYPVIHLTGTNGKGSTAAMPADVLAKEVRSFGVPATPVPRPAQALSAAVTAAGRTGMVVAAGSLHLIAPLRAAALKRPAGVLP
jgi:folylpolyglutamate synthase/dihydropteroate synthase